MYATYQRIKMKMMPSGGPQGVQAVRQSGATRNMAIFIRYHCC